MDAERNNTKERTSPMEIWFLSSVCCRSILFERQVFEEEQRAEVSIVLQEKNWMFVTST